MTERTPEFLAQNKRINELSRQLGRIEPDVNTLKHAIEPKGYISKAFEKIEEHLDEQDQKIFNLEQQMNKRMNSLEQTVHHNFADLRSSLNHILESITKLSDLPEE